MSGAKASERATGHVKVLVTLDGSGFASQVIPYVVRVLRPDTHALTLLRVAPVPEGYAPLPPRPLPLDAWTAADGLPGGDPPVYYSQEYESAVANLAEELFDEGRRLEAAGFEVEPYVRFGDAADEIVAALKEHGHELIVMATHGRSGIGRMLLGSVADAVLRRVHVPVMMVRPLPEGAGEKVEVPAQAPRRADTPA